MNLYFPPGEKQNNIVLSCGQVCFSLNAEMVSNRNSVTAGAGPFKRWDQFDEIGQTGLKPVLPFWENAEKFVKDLKGAWLNVQIEQRN